MEPLSALAPAHDEGHRLMRAVADWTVPTPCPDWDAADLVIHEVAGNRLFAARLAGATPDPVAVDAELRGHDPADLPALFLASARALEAAFCVPGALEAPILLRIGTVPGLAALHLRLVETMVHGWDLARATGQRAEFPDELVEAELIAAQALLARLPEGVSPFGAPVSIAHDAPALDRLVALLGRDPS